MLMEFKYSKDIVVASSRAGRLLCLCGVLVLSILFSTGCCASAVDCFTLSLHDKPLNLALEEIKKQSSVPLTIDCTWAKLVRVNAQTDCVDLDQALKLVLGGLGYAILYEEDDDGNLLSMEINIATPADIAKDAVIGFISEYEDLPNMVELAQIIEANERKYEAQNFFMIGDAHASKAEWERIKNTHRDDYKTYHFGDVEVSKDEVDRVHREYLAEQDLSVVVHGGVVIPKAEIEAVRMQKQQEYAESARMDRGCCS